VAKRKTKKPLIVAMVGLVASGKSSVAKELAPKLHATAVSTDNIRRELRKHHARYTHVPAMEKQIVRHLLQQGSNVIIDADFVSKDRYTRFKKSASKRGIRLEFIQVTCDIDIAIGRVIAAAYNHRPDDLFGKAESAWTDKRTKGATVRIRELWRRTPLHYTWADPERGQWELKKLPFPVFAHVDTSDPKVWKPRVAAIAKKLLAAT
jgi:predicted kinase